MPALATHRAAKWCLWFGYAVGLSGYVLGLMLSALFDLPAGAIVVWAMFGVALLV